MELLKLIIVSAAGIGAFILTAKATYHMYHVVTNVTGKYSNFFGPLLLLMPSQFNEKGNRHRIALGPVLLWVMACWFVLLLFNK